jgi:hypothetical protein
MRKYVTTGDIVLVKEEDKLAIVVEIDNSGEMGLFSNKDLKKYCWYKPTDVELKKEATQESLALLFDVHGTRQFYDLMDYLYEEEDDLPYPEDVLLLREIEHKLERVLAL